MHAAKELQAFGSYPHADQLYADRLSKAIGNYFRADKRFRISEWRDLDLIPGEDWHEAIQSAIRDASVAFLYVSPAFLGSGYIREHEMDQLLNSSGKVVIPVMLKPIDLERMDLGELAKRQIFTLNGRAYSECQAQHDKFELALYQKVHDRLAREYPNVA